jgi:hypothetical protein
MRIFVLVLAGLAFLGMMFAILGPFGRYGPVLDQPSVGVAYKIVCDETKGHDYAVTTSTKEAEIAYESAEKLNSTTTGANEPTGPAGPAATMSAIPDGTTIRVIDEEPKWGGWGEIVILEGDRAGETAFINIPDQKYEEVEKSERASPILSRLAPRPPARPTP